MFLEEIEGIERVPAPSKAPRMSTETLEAAEEVWGVLEAAKAELAELRGVEGMLKQTREALAASEASEKALAERLAPLEEELASTKSRYESARDAAAAEKASLTARLDALEKENAASAAATVETERLSHRTQPRGIQSDARALMT